MERRQLTLSYRAERDILLLKLANRPAKAHVNRFDFVTRFDEETNEIVGFEILDFGSRFIPHLYEAEAIPAEVLDLRFDLAEGGLQDADLRSVLLWAFHQYCTCHLPVHQSAPEAAAAA